MFVGDAAAIIARQGSDISPSVAGGDNGEYAILVFDAPTQVTGQLGDGSGETTRTANMLGIAEYTPYNSFDVKYGDLDLCKSLQGQHQTVAVKSQNIMFPSDVRLPINEPSAREIVFL